MKINVSAAFLTCSSLLFFTQSATAQSFGQLKSAAIEAQAAKRYSEADSFWQKAIDSCQDKSGPRYLQGLGGLAKSLSEQGKFAEAEVLYKKILELTKAETTSNETKLLLKDYATMLRSNNRAEEADKLEKDYSLASLDTPAVKTTSTEDMLAAAKKEAQEKKAKIVQDLQSALSQAQKEANNKQFTLAEASGQRALKFAEDSAEPSYAIPALKILAHIYDAQNKLTQAESMARRCADLSKTKYGTVSKAYADTLNFHAELLRKMNRRSEAIAEEGRVDEIKSKLSSGSSGSSTASGGAPDNSAAIAGTRGGSLYKRAGAAQHINNSNPDIGD